MSKSQRTKGHNYEREVARTIAEAMPDVNIRRGLQYQHARGAKVPDVDMPWWWVECKRGKRPIMRKALHQAEADSEGSHKRPVAVIRDDGDTSAYVVMRFCDWLETIVELHELRSM